MKDLFRIWLRLPTQVVSSSKASFAFLICLLVLIFSYRVQLTMSLLMNRIRPFDFNPASHLIGFMLAFLPYDLAVVLGCFLLCGLLSRGALVLRQGKCFFFLQILGIILLHIFLIALLLVHGAHLRLLFDAQTGLDTSILLEVLLNVSLAELIKFIGLKDYVFLFIPIGLFWMVMALRGRLRVWVARGSVVLLLFLSIASIVAIPFRHPVVPAEIRLNPAFFLISDVAENLFLRPAILGRQVKFFREPESGSLPTGFAYRHQTKPGFFSPARKAHPWNIVFLIMESVGTRYMFDTSYGNRMPMPFLNQLVKESWYLKRHYTASNISTKAVFSLLSGLYDFFRRETFGIRSDASVPSIYSFLADHEERFLVTPAPINWYFPKAFAKNSGLTEMHHFENLNFKVKEEQHSLGRYIGRDEIQTMDFFIQKINRAKEPFLAIYLSFTAHLPYFDYGPDYRVMEDDGRTISRYYNNLNLLDHMIRRLYENLQKQGLLERTILVIVGDHGQAFGQHHPDNYMHHRYSYNENLETPAILYQPALFSPMSFEFPTSHVDILPTLLDAMGIPHDPLLFDGESLFHHRLKRTFVFCYGHEESISLVDKDLIKVQQSLKRNRCWAFDLKLDPDEKNPLDCSSYPLQFEVLHKFVRDHDSKLLEYNESLKEKKRMSGGQAPVVKD